MRRRTLIALLLFVFMGLKYYFRKSLLILFLLFFGVAGVYAQTKLSFFTELEANSFAELFEDPEVIETLQLLKAELRVGMIDLSEARARTILKLNEAGIPVTAWLLLPKSEGYFFHARNGEQAIARYESFRDWSNQYSLKWKGIGIDLEPAMEEIGEAINHPFLASWKAYRRLYDKSFLRRGLLTYEKLIEKVREDGYPLESYVIPIIYDERKAGVESFQQILGILDIQTDKEIAMCYSSSPGANPAAIPDYAKEADAIAIGSTGGGVNIEGFSLPALDWESFSRDLRLAHHTEKEIHIFSLEGCIEHGFFKLLVDFDFQEPVSLYSKEIQNQHAQRRKITKVLTVLSYPLWLTIGFIFIVVLIIFLLYKLIRYLIRLIFRRSKNNVGTSPHILL